MKIPALISCLILTLQVFTARAEDTFANLDDAKLMATRMLEAYVNKDQAEAFRGLPRISTSKTDEDQRTQIQKYVQWNAQTSEKRGAARGFQLVSTKVVVDSVARLRYLVNTERLPLVIDFFMYRTSPTDRWALSDLQMISGPAKLFANEEQ